MKKTDKVAAINTIIARNAYAVSRQAEAFIAEDGRLEYRMSNGRYIMKASFREIRMLLPSVDMLEMNKYK